MSTKKMTAIELLSQSKEEKNAEENQYLVEDATTDIHRAVETAKRDIAKLERGESEFVIRIVKGSSFDGILQLRRDIKQKKEDLEELQIIADTYFPKS